MVEMKQVKLAKEIDRTELKRPVIFVVALSLMKHGLSGGDVRLRAMLQRWQKKADVIVFTSPSGRHNMESWDINVSYVTSSHFPERLRSNSALFAQLGSYWALASIRTGKTPATSLPDMIYVQNDFPFEARLGVRIKKKFPNARLVSLSHHSYREIYKLTGIWYYLVLRKMQEYSFRLMAKYADLVTVLPTVTGDYCRDDLIKAGVAENKIECMWNGVDLDIIDNIDDVDKKYDACIIGLRRNKGLEDIPVIWTSVCERRPGSVLYIIGSIADADKKWLQQELSAVGFGNSVKFGGHFSPPELYKEIKKARICIAPTHQEPYGIAICEAMACGLPVVGYDLANYRRLHDGIVSAVSSFYSSEFAEVTAELLENTNKLQKMAKLGKEHISAFDNDKIAEHDLSTMLS